MLVFLIVGHTHHEVDRFFSRVKVAMTGQDYFTREAMMAVLYKNLRDMKFDDSHLTTVWDWEGAEKAIGLPRTQHMQRVHGINIFRQHGGVYMKWKQYLTSEGWSRPILLLPNHLFPVAKNWYPDLVPKGFEMADASSKNMWLNKLEVAMADNADYFEKHRVDIQSLRDTIAGRLPQYTEGLLKLAICI